VISVLHVLTDDQRRGAQVFGWALAQRLDEMGVDDRVVALTRVERGVPLPVETLGSRARGRTTLRRLREAMGEVDLTVAHGSSTLVACALAGRGGRPFVYRQISDPAFWAGTLPRAARMRVAYRFPRHVVSLSDRSAEVLVDRFGVDRPRITVIPNAVDERTFPAATPSDRVEARRALGLPPDAPVIAYVGALSREKGVLDLLAVVRPREHLLMAGQGPLEDEVTSTAASNGLHVHLVGSRPDLRAIYAACDVLALPSWSEQQPAVLLEAGLAARPTVATMVGVVDELVVDGLTGHLVPPHDLERFRAALDRVLDDTDGAEAMGQAGRAHVLRSFTLGEVAVRWHDLLRRLLE
jgi:glycosyltransferase involved in cell wall biosynthesis